MSICRQIRGAALASVAGLALMQIGMGEQPVRAIEDPSCGVRWILVPSPDHAAGPGHWLLSPASTATVAAPGASGTARASAAPVIRAGDRIRVEEHTAVVDATLEAIALKDATTGATLRARLKVGQRVVRAIALGPGRAELASPEERHP